MKRKIFAVTMILLLAFSFAGCGKKKDSSDDKNSEETVVTDKDEFPKEATDTKSDLLIFVNKNLAAIDGKRKNALAIYNSYFETPDANVDEYAKRLNDEALPDMKAFVEELRAIEVKTDEVLALKTLLEDCASRQYKAIKLACNAINELNHDKVVKADKYISKATELYKQYQSELEQLAKSCDIEIK